MIKALYWAPRLTARLSHILLIICGLTAFAAMAGCGSGGGTGSGGGGGGVTPDFSVSVSAASVAVQAGSTNIFTVSIIPTGGFSGSVSLTTSGTPAGVSLSPATFTLAPNASQTVTISATASASGGASNLLISATSGSLTHSATVSLTVSVPVPDFSVGVSPSSLSIQGGSSGSFTVTVTGVAGFNGTVALTISGAPSAITLTPATFSLSSGGSQTVQVLAGSTTTAGSATLTVAGMSGSVAHTATVTLTLSAVPPGAASRLKYVRTDSVLSGDLSFFPQPHVFYSASTRRFFFADSSLNRIHVFDATTEKKIGEVLVPGAFQLDESADGKTLWVGTQVGDVYTVDPAALTVLHRYPSLQIGPSGFSSFEVHPLADGTVFLLGGQGGIAAVDGYSIFAIWNPASNSLKTPTMCVDGIAIAAVTADRTGVVMTSFSTSRGLCLYTPATDIAIKTVVNGYEPFSVSILPPPDGKEILVSEGTEFDVYSLPLLQFTDKIPVSGKGVLSRDGNTLFVFGSGTLDAYNWRTHSRLGWASSVSLPVGEFYYNNLTPLAADETGLIAGLVGAGVGFADGGALLSGSDTVLSVGAVTPAAGSPSGGDSPTLTVSGSVNSVFFGSSAASNLSSATGTIKLTTPAGSGIADVSAFSTTGAEGYVPEAWSYGPNVLEATANYITADAGSTISIFGQGLSPGGTGTDITATVGGQVARVAHYTAASSLTDLPAYVDLTIPAGVAGTTEDIVLRNSLGSVTLSGALKVLPAVQKFPLNGAALYQGVYDKQRNLYYFTDAGSVQVFSRASGWLTPFTLPATTATKRLWGLALSPDNSHLAIADPGSTSIYVLDPGNPSNVKAYAIPAVVGIPVHPNGVAITNDGQVFYLVSEEGTGTIGLYHLDTSTGTVTGVPSANALDIQNSAVRLLLSKDGDRVYENLNGVLTAVDTSTGQLFQNSLVTQTDDFDMALSTNATTLAGDGYIVDTNLGLQAYIAENGREAADTAVYGEKLTPDGSLLICPLVNGLDLFDARTGVHAGRVALPVALAPVYDALVSDGNSNVLVAITGPGDGVVVIDLSSLPLPSPLPYLSSNIAVKSAWIPYIVTATPVSNRTSIAAGKARRHLMVQTF